MKKPTALVIALVMALSLAACGSDSEGAEPVEFVEPAAEDFVYNYDAALGGVKITGYIGGTTAIRIPAELDGDPVKQISLNGYSGNITYVELPDGITGIDFMNY